MLVASDSPLPPNSLMPASDREVSERERRARQVIELGLTARSASRCIPGPEQFYGISANLAAQVAMIQGQLSSGLIDRSNIMGPILDDQGQHGATLDPSDFDGAPQIVPLNLTPDMVAQRNPEVRRTRKKPGSGNVKRAGVPWGGLPLISPGSCGSPEVGTFSQNVNSKPWFALLLAAGIGVLVLAAVSE